MPNKLSWCELSLRQKIILFLAHVNRPMTREEITAAIWALDKHYKCEAQQKQARSTTSNH